MYRRFRNAAVTLVALVVAYQAYTLSVGSLLDPPPPVAADQGDADWGAHVQNSVERYQRLLANYFPAGHWSLTGSPKVLEHAEANSLLVYGDLNRDRFGRVDVTNTALVYFPTPRRGPDDAPRDAIVIDAPGVAKLQFDEAFNPASGRFGWPKRGLFEGELTIRSDMAQAGPSDDLFVQTRDLRLEGPLVASDAVVTARLGRSEASGRILEIQLLEDPYAAPDDAAAAIGLAGLASLEVREDVRAQIVLDEPQASGVVVASQAPNAPAAVYGRHAVRPASASVAAAGPPVEVSSDGSFRFDFTSFVASMQESVTVTRPRPGGPPDTLTCDELEARFSREDGRSAQLRPHDEPELAAAQGRTLAGLRVERIDAVGSPAKLEAPAVLGAAEGRRLQLWVGQTRVRVEAAPAGRLAMVAYGLNEARAAWIDYAAPPAGSGRSIGDLSMAGPGWLRVATKPGDPTRLVEARWKATPGAGGEPTESVRIVRDAAGNPVLHALGEPELAAAGVGWMKAARLKATLIEAAPDGKAGPVVETPATHGGQPGGFLVRTVEADGGVDFRGEELEGRVDRLLAKFTPVATAPTRSASPSLGQTRSTTRKAKDRYRVTGREITIDVDLRGRRAEPTAAVCRGEVLLQQQGDADALRVTGEALRAEGLAGDGVRLTVLGNADEADAKQKNRAEVQTRGLRIGAAALHVDQAIGRAWVDGAGDARFLSDKTSRTPSPLGDLGPETTITWRDGVEIIGDTLTARGEVLAEGREQRVQCAELVATLTKPIDFRGGGGDLEVARVDCGGGVWIDHRTSDPAGQTSHQRLQLRTLGADLRTGEMTGQGPGWIRSVHYSGAASSIADGGSPSALVAQQGDPLRLLRVDFMRGMTGNLNTRVVRFQDRVRALYTPVSSWDDQPPPVSPTGPAPGAVTLACQELRVSEDPAGRFATAGPRRRDRLGPLEMYATGAVRIEGRPEGSPATIAQSFAAEAVSGSYSQAKEVFVLEGDATRSATIWRQSAPGRQPERVDGRKLLYWPKLDKFKYEDVRGGVLYGAGAQQPGATPGMPARR
ncbi:MAG: hypothetical protein AAFV43_02260 [Planctomycetota bacterium]